MKIKKEKMTAQERLEKVFAAVDQIKKDLNGAWGVKVDNQSHSLSIAIDRKVIWWTFDGVHLFRDGEVIGLPITDFYATYFPEANSVLYRFEVDGHEQIRGYIFLKGMGK